MTTNNLVLFGKHPAWSDHMFLSNGATVSHYLKRVFYDHSVIPALQGGKGDRKISETWSFLVVIEEQAFFIVNAVSRDSVGRRRFPLIVAYPLPHEIKLEAALETLRELKQELLSLLNEMLEPASEDLNQWQEAVKQKLKSFQSKVDWSSIDSGHIHCQLKRDEVLGLMSRLADDYNSLDLKSCSFTEAYNFLQLGLKQFKSAPPAMLILDQEERGAGLFFATEGGTSFHLKRYLYNNLTPLAVSANNVPPKVSRLLKSAGADDKGVLKVNEVPSLKLSIHQSPAGHKLTIMAIASAFIVSLFLGLFYSCSSGNSPDSAISSETGSARQMSGFEKWNLSAIAYVEWIQPLIVFTAEQPTPIPGFDPVARVLESDLNPFDVVETEEANMEMAENPPEGFLDPENSTRLNAVYDNIDQLKASLTAYYEEQFSDKLVKELKRQNYPQPSFIKVDFSQQPILPNFGPELNEQLKLLLTSRNALDEVVTETKMLWDSIIKPLHQLCPEHAKFIQHCVHHLVVESKSLKQFKDKHTALLEVFGYPDFIKLDKINMSELAENSDWINLPEKERTIESMHKLVELLEAYHEDKKQSQPTGIIEQTPEDPTLSSMEQTSQSVEQKTATNPEQAASSSVENTLLKKTLPSAEKNLTSGEQALQKGEQVLQLGKKAMPETEEQALQSVIDLSEWNLFLEAGLEYFRNDRLISEIKSHANALKSQILEDTTLESDQALPKYKEQVTELVAAFKRLDVSSLKKTSEFHTVYMESEQRLQHLSDYLFTEYEAADIDKGNVESVAEVSQEISDSVDTYLADLNQSFAELETNYFLSQKSEATPDLSEQFVAVTENPLYVNGLFDTRLSILKTAASYDGAIAIKTAKDLVWYLENTIAKGRVGEKQLSTVTAAFNTLNTGDRSGELKSLIRAAFDKGTQELSASDSSRLLEIYKNLSTYLPGELQTPKDKGFQKIAAYWSRYNVDLNAAKPAKAELEKLRNSAGPSVVKQFYTGLLDEYDRTDSQSSSTFLEEIEKSRGIESISINDDRTQIDVAFEDRFGKLTFLPIETEEGTVFVQQTPLSLQQYIKLSSLCDFDTEYYLTLQDTLWPRSFEVGMGSQFSTLEEWQFRNRDVFSPINAFNRKTLPAHLNEPDRVLRMARFFGFRLLKFKECAAFIRLADGLPAKSLEFSAVDKENLKKFNTIQSSVYAETITELSEQDAWSGGIDFERGAPVKNQFFDVAGGSAELAYNGTDFYAMGGSWLCEPPELEKPQRIAEPKRMYIDLGVRFAMDAPTQGYNKLVQKIALQVLTDRK